MSNMSTIGAGIKLKTLITSRYGKTLPQIFDMLFYKVEVTLKGVQKLGANGGTETRF